MGTRKLTRSAARGALVAMAVLLGSATLLPAAAANAAQPASNVAPPPMDYVLIQCQPTCTHAGQFGRTNVWSLVGAAGGEVAYIFGDTALYAYVPRGAGGGIGAFAGITVTVNPGPPANSGTREQGSNLAPATDAGSLYNVAQAIGATDFWKDGYTGQGVDVAVIDSGIAPLKYFGDRLVNARDLSFDASDASDPPDPTKVAGDGIDAFGHGTHVAGIIGGADPSAPIPAPGQTGKALVSAAKTKFVGIAPGSRLINVRVGASNGAVDVSQIIAAIDWVVLHKNDTALGAAMNIRVLNLSFGTDGYGDYAHDPLAAAVENAWRAGIVVVASAGNEGYLADPKAPDAVPLDNPAYDPYVIAVGASDSMGTVKPTDDTLAGYSSRGTVARHADVIAPGTSITSLAVPGSMIDATYPGGRVGADFFKGTGTSQAAAVVSGAAALMLSRYPQLKPDDIKWWLDHSGSSVLGAGHKTNGDYAKVFQVDLAKDSLSVAAATKHVTPQISTNGDLLHTNTAGFHLDAARGSMGLSVTAQTDAGPVTTSLSGDYDVTGAAWDGTLWRDNWKAYLADQVGNSALASWLETPRNGPVAGAVYGGGSWNGRVWRSLGWSNGVAVDTAWQGRVWRDGAWH